MSKLEATNVFNEGLITDLNPITTPNNVLTNALNATLITMNGNEFVLQNDLGNGRVETAKLPTGFVPLGVKEYGGIIYVASYNPLTKMGQLGSFPSPERNLTQDEIGNKNISVSKSDFSSGDTLTTYYKRIDVMPDDMYLNPGDKFGLFISGTGYDLLSYYSSSNARAITFHPAIIDDYGIINYIDEECKVDGVYSRGLIFGSPGDLSTVDGYRKAFDQLLVYKGKKSGKLILIVELETLDDFVVSRSVSSNKEISQKIGSSDVKYSDEDSSEKVSFKLTFNNSGWAKPDNELIKFTGVKFESNFGNFGLTTSSKNNTISYSLDDFTRDQILKYKITPYTQLGACEALARTGIVNFSLFGTGNIILNEWRYYVDNNKIRINYGLDTNLLEGESIKEVSFEFFDIYYNTIYKNKFICGSTINGNYNGNYTETLNLPYDLNYKDTYSSGISNKDYIANNVVGKSLENKPAKYTLKSNELLKNNLYCVKITVTTTGLNTGNQIRTFYRFLWTTGYFNEEYIKNEESNFSVLQIPSKYIPKFKLKCEYDIDSSDFVLDYLNNPTQNGADSPFIYSSEKPISDSSIRANLYQDWKLSNAKIKVTTKLESEDANSLFGDYNAGWFSLEDLSNTTITYDNNSQIINKPSGELSAENSKYIDITDEELSTFDKNGNVINLHKLLEKANYSITFENLRNGNVNSKLVELKRNGTITDNEYKNALEWIELINDSQLYTEGTYETSTIKDGEDPIITISNIEGRLIRRLTGNLTDPNYTTAVINELRPCIYTNMTNNELSVMVGGASVTVGTDIISNSGEVLYLGADAGYKDDDATKIYSFWGKSDNYVDNMYLLQQIGGKDTNGNKSDVGQTVGLSYDIIRRNLADVAGHSAIYLLQGGIHDNLKNNGSDGGSYKCPEDFGSLGVGFYTENSNKNNHPYNTNFMVGFKEEGTLTYVFGNKRVDKIVTIVVWRTSDAGDNNNQFAAINLGSVNGYNECITNCVTPILKIMHILHKNIERELWITKLSRMAYHGIFPTKVNIGYSINKDSIKAAEGKCPIKLYDNRPFNEETIKDYLNSEKWNIEEDKWFKSIESTIGEPNVLQCSYINIPYDKIDTIYENNTVKRSSVDIDLTELTELETDTYLLGVTLDLGTQIDASIIYDQFIAYLNGESVYKPTLIYIDKGTSSYELLEGVDSLGNPFSANNIYYKTAPGVYVSGSSDEATRIKLFSNEACTNLKNLFVVGSINGSPVPVLNNNNLGNRIEKLSTNVSDGGNRKHISDIRMCRDIYLRNSTYKPLK